jgi:hypothetical protein
MKCIRNNKSKKVKRVTNDHAKREVEAGKAVYVNKETWKKEVRDA